MGPNRLVRRGLRRQPNGRGRRRCRGSAPRRCRAAGARRTADSGRRRSADASPATDSSAAVGPRVGRTRVGRMRRGSTRRDARSSPRPNGENHSRRTSAPVGGWPSRSPSTKRWTRTARRTNRSLARTPSVSRHRAAHSPKCSSSSWCDRHTASSRSPATNATRADPRVSERTVPEPSPRHTIAGNLSTH